MPSLSSVIEMIGMYRANSENSSRNQANAPTVMLISVSEGCQKRHCDGSKLDASDPAIITKRSNHIPMFTKIVTMNSGTGLVRTRGENSASGMIQLQSTITQNIHPHGPKYRIWKVICSIGSWLYQV